MNKNEIEKLREVSQAISVAANKLEKLSGNPEAKRAKKEDIICSLGASRRRLDQAIADLNKSK